MAEMILIPADCIQALKKMRENSIDSMVTDPPYGWRFMGKAWDAFDIEQSYKKRAEEEIARKGKVEKYTPGQAAGIYDLSLQGNLAFQAWTKEWAREVYRVLKPGGHILVFCGPRTYHRMASGVEDAGFEIRDQMQWLFGSGFPKSLNIGKQLPAYEGYGTALKPANEPILLARKPLSEKTVAKNVLLHGTGGINIDGCRVGTSKEGDPNRFVGQNKHCQTTYAQDSWTKENYKGLPINPNQGRFPANLVLSHDEECELVGSKKVKLNGSGIASDKSHGFQSAYVGGIKKAEGFEGSFTQEKGTETVAAYNCTPTCAVKMLDEQSINGGMHGAGKARDKGLAKQTNEGALFGIGNHEGNGTRIGDSGGASRFFYCAKASKSERNLGCETNHHPTVKPLKLMRYLCRLVTPPNGVILDPFMGSGSTGVAALQEEFHFIGIERESEYFKIALTRIRYEIYGDE